jgi:putative endonuclease
MPSSDNKPTSKKATTPIGQRYEKQAARFFEREGYEILERNWRSGRKEIDLIVRSKRELVFVEVKAALSQRYGHPAERVDQKKQAHLIEAARHYMVEKEISDLDVRFDVVTFSEGKLEHFPGAFMASE